jgi:mannose-6-phosphate isomerase-like protein (cupin superfamily)
MSGQDDSNDTLAAEYVLGTLTGEARARFEEALADDPQLDSLVAQWEQRLAPLNDHIIPMKPPAGLWDRIDLNIDAMTSPAAGAVSIRVDEGGWTRLVHGIDRKLLFTDPASGTETFLLRFAPGAWLPAHAHRLCEQCLMLEGDVRIGDETFGPGDFHAVPAGTPHPAIVSESGALVLIVGEIR